LLTTGQRSLAGGVLAVNHSGSYYHVDASNVKTFHMTSNFDANTSQCDKQPQTGLCFGGSFNPIHNGHLLCAKAAAIYRNFKRIVVIPSAKPPHKPEATDLA